MFEADYVNKEKKVKGAIIDNQSHNMLTGIQESDVRDVDSMGRVCLKLYGGVTKFTHCWEVIKECNRQLIHYILWLKVSIIYNYVFSSRCKLISYLT